MGQTPPLDRILDTRYWKYYLAPTSLRAVIISFWISGWRISLRVNTLKLVINSKENVTFCIILTFAPKQQHGESDGSAATGSISWSRHQAARDPRSGFRTDVDILGSTASIPKASCRQVVPLEQSKEKAIASDPGEYLKNRSNISPVLFTSPQELFCSGITRHEIWNEYGLFSK